MTEGLFLITTLFVAYVVYVIIKEKKAGNVVNTSTPLVDMQKPAAVMQEKAKATSTASLKAEPVKKSPAKPAAAKATPKPAQVKAAAKPATAKASTAKAPEPVAAPQAAAKGKGLKDPKTGEVVTSYTNYRFMKRWIKEALVAEGLVDKIYKNDELNAGLESKIRTAIDKLEAIKKYQP